MTYEARNTNCYTPQMVNHRATVRVRSLNKIKLLRWEYLLFGIGMDQNGKGHWDGKKFEDMRITMYHPFYSRSALGIVSLSDYITRNHRLQLFFQLYSCTFFLMGYEKIIALGFKKIREKNQFISSKSCNLLVTMI